MDDLAVKSSQETDEETLPQNEKEGKTLKKGKKRNKNKKQKKRKKEPSSEERPWRKCGVDITDYFNYGFTEETWRAYCRKQREMQAAKREMVESHSKQEEDQPWPSTSSDSSSLFPRCHESSSFSEDHYQWTRRSRKVSSPEEDRATHLFTSPDFMCPSDLYVLPQLSPVSNFVAMDCRERVRSRDQRERSEGQHGVRERRREEALASCSNTSPTKDQSKDRDKSKRRHREAGEGGKARRQPRRHPLPESKTNGSLLFS